MRSTSFNAQALAYLPALIAPALAQHGAYFTMGSPALVIESVDPLINPGGQSGHVHSVVGGSAFAPTMDFGTTQTSKCTTFGVTDDLSNYWMPAVYFRKNGKFTLVPEASPKHKVYYKYGKGDNTPDLERSEFPQGFRMMAGNSNTRSDDGSFGSPGSQLNWQCHGSGNQRATGFPKGFTSCSGNYIGGLAATMRFPSCWNGQDFNKDAPLAHMAYPTNRDGLAGCPAGFNKARFPEIMIEYWLDVSQFDGQYGADEVPWVLANGDPTGYGFHMDFINGWKPGTLGKAIKSCDIGNTGDPLDSPQCFGAGSVQSESAKQACKIAPVINQDVGLNGPLDQLPGCNPIQAGPGPATKATNCAGGSVSPSTSVPAPVGSSKASSATSASTATTQGLVISSTPASSAPANKPTTSAQPVKSSSSAAPNPGPTGTSDLKPQSVASTSGTWKAVGCYSDALNPRSLGTGRLEWWGEKITSSNCVKHCDSIGAKVAGTENGGQCFCGSGLTDSALTPGKCTTACVGDAKETCGGPARLSVYSRDGTVTVTKRRKHQRHSRHFKIAS